jgi:hypothetical protein
MMTPVELPHPVHVAACPHPFRAGRVDLEVPAGGTVREIVAAVRARSGLPAGVPLHAHVFLDDRPVPRGSWHRARPGPGARLVVRVVPTGGGGGGKDVLRATLALAVIVTAAVVAPELAAAVGGGAITQGLIATGIGTAGPLVTAAMAPP